MKYLKKINELVESYKFNLVSDDDYIINYNFIDIDNNEYLVQFKNDTIGPKSKPQLSKTYELTFYTKDENNNWSVSIIVNSNIWRLLKTIFTDILNDFLERKKWVRIIRMEGLSKEIEKEYVSQRTKIYLRHLQRNPINGFKIEYFGSNKINLVRI